MTQFKSPAKINVGLFVYKKQSNGYHPLNTLFFGINLFDYLYIEKSPDFHLSCDDPNIPIDDNNIITKTWKLFSSLCQTKTSLKIHLEKKLPSQAGIGGASGNAALILWLLNELHNCIFDDTTLSSIALKIGADVPFFLKPTPCFAQGIGEIFTSFDIKQKVYLVLIKPKFSIKTSEAFLYLDHVERETKIINKSQIENIFKNKQFHSLQALLSNDFELMPNIFNDIFEIKQKFYNLNAKYSSLTGSGSCIYGIYSSKKEAIKAYRSLSLNYETYLCETLLNHSPEFLNQMALKIIKSI
ncbi:MAG: 4-(cytidine 5'-diphospho)-2-C-methyl-D-erythritol kinase [Candidatus Cloacimonadota bacterium]|nr:MAG: 4-(cytidine 5'-diphospho)-2-C-methyl-D-erythritol kinase [Candidatus Cloacimonadota bacterium]